MMELNPKQQVVELVKSSKRVLILTHMNPDGDALGSLLALSLALRKMGKEVSAVCPDGAPRVFKFLPELEQIKNQFDGTKDFVITVDSTQTKVDKLGYKNIPEENKLNIVVTPKSGTFSPEDVTFSYGSFKYDLIFVLDAPDLERLGHLYESEAELFYETPIINIDHHPGNDHFGKVNWVELTSTSTAEILVSVIESLGRETNLMDADIATCLLTGIITDTGSFQNNNTTPKSFTVAAQLIAAGARQQDIIKHIYKTRPLSTLKIWGKILSNIHEETNERFIWSSITSQELLSFGANEDETSGVIDELLKTVPDTDFALLLSERANGVHGSLRGISKGVDVSQIAQIFSGGGHGLAAAFNVANTSLAESGNQIIAKIKQFQNGKINQTNNIPPTNESIVSNQEYAIIPDSSVQTDLEEISDRFAST